MSEKIKVAFVCDFAAASGFAAVAHQLAHHLDELGTYDIKVLGINYYGQPHPWAKRFDVWPAKLGGDFLGVGYLKNFMQEVQPDLLFLFQDFWNIPLYIGEIHHGFKKGIVTYYPVDSPNMKGEYMVAMAAAAEVACYTDFGIEESVRASKEAYNAIRNMAEHNNVDYTSNIRVSVRAGLVGQGAAPVEIDVSPYRLKQLMRPQNYHKIPHGIDLEHFHHIGKDEARDKVKVPRDWFIVGNVNRNQSRKRQDLTIQAFADFAKDKPNARLLLHSVRNDIKGWDLVQLAQYYDVTDKMIMTHDMFPSKEATIEQLNLIYNTLDVQINTGGGEGWGLTSFEGAGCKVPQIVPNWSATKEIWEGSGKLIDVAAIRHEPMMINTAQAVIDYKHCSQLLSELYENDELREQVGNDCYEVTQRPEYSWETIAEKLDSVFLSALGEEPKRTPVAFTPKGVQELKKQGVIK